MLRVGLDHQITLNFRLFICRKDCKIPASDGFASLMAWAATIIGLLFPTRSLEIQGNGHNILIYWVGSLKCHLWGNFFFPGSSKNLLSSFLGEKNKSHTKKIELFLYWHEWQIHIQKHSATGLFLYFLNSIRLNKVNRNKVSQEIVYYNWYFCVNGISKSQKVQFQVDSAVIMWNSFWDVCSEPFSVLEYNRQPLFLSKVQIKSSNTYPQCTIFMTTLLRKRPWKLAENKSAQIFFVLHIPHMPPQNHRIIKSIWLKKPSKVIKSNY